MIPSIGRIVHFCLPGWALCAGQERPAIITNVQVAVVEMQIPVVDLTVFSAPADHDLQTLSLAAGIQEGNGAGQWHSYEDCPKSEQPVEVAPVS